MSIDNTKNEDMIMHKVERNEVANVIMILIVILKYLWDKFICDGERGWEIKLIDYFQILYWSEKTPISKIGVSYHKLYKRMGCRVMIFLSITSSNFHNVEVSLLLVMLKKMHIK